MSNETAFRWCFIGTGTLAAKVAKEEYETITGEPFRSVADANRWARMAER